MIAWCGARISAPEQHFSFVGCVFYASLTSQRFIIFSRFTIANFRLLLLYHCLLACLSATCYLSFLFIHSFVISCFLTRTTPHCTHYSLPAFPYLAAHCLRRFTFFCLFDFDLPSPYLFHSFDYVSLFLEKCLFSAILRKIHFSFLFFLRRASFFAYDIVIVAVLLYLLPYSLLGGRRKEARRRRRARQQPSTIVHLILLARCHSGALLLLSAPFIRFLYPSFIASRFFHAAPFSAATLCVFLLYFVLLPFFLSFLFASSLAHSSGSVSRWQGVRCLQSVATIDK